jgi:hypothetical protein
MRLAADVGGVTSQYVALLRGDDVTLTREKVAGFVSQNKRPANLDEHDVCVLRGDDELMPLA